MHHSGLLVTCREALRSQATQRARSKMPAAASPRRRRWPRTAAALQPLVSLLLPLLLAGLVPQIAAGLQPRHFSRALAQAGTASRGAATSHSAPNAAAPGVGSGGGNNNNNNATTAALGAWAQGSNFSVPVTAKAFRFGTRGENVTLANNFCGYGPISSPYVVGISPDSPLALRRPLAGCGTCLEVICQPGSPACTHPEAATLTPASTDAAPTGANTSPEVVIPGRLLLRVADKCDSCGPLDLNLHADAFTQLGDLQGGVLNVTYRYVTCPSFDRNISVYVNAFRPSQGGWLRLSVRDVAGNGLAAVALAHCPRPPAAGGGEGAGAATNTSAAAGRSVGTGGSIGGGGGGGGLTPGCAGTLRGPSWRVMRNTVGAQWEYSGLPTLPLDLRLTDVEGREIIVWGAIANKTAPAVYGTRSQFAPPPPAGAEQEGVGYSP